MAQKNNPQAKRVPASPTDRVIVRLVLGLILLCLGGIIFLSNALNLSGSLFDVLRQLSRGLCGSLAIILPVIPVWGGLLTFISLQRKPSLRSFLLTVLLLVLLCTAATLLTFVGTDSLLDYMKASIAKTTMADVMPAYLTRAFDFGGRYGIGGGLIGMLLAWPLWKGLGTVFSAVLVILASVVVFLFLIRLDVKGLAGKAKAHNDQRRAQQADADAQRQQQELMWKQEEMRRMQAVPPQPMQPQMPPPQPMPPQQQMQPQQQMPWPPHNYQQIGYEDTPNPTVPVVQRVQVRGKKQSAQQPGFQPGPIDPGAYTAADTSAEAPRKRGGIFNRDKNEEAIAIPRKKSLFSRDAEEAPADPFVQPPRQRTAPVKPVFSSEVEKQPLQSVYQRPEPQPDMAEVTFTPEEPVFEPAETVTTPAPRPAAAPVKATAPIPHKPVTPPEEIDTDFAAETETKPVSENSFLARLRAAKKAAGLEVPEENTAAKSQPAATPRPTARHADSADDDWANTPPWEETAAPATPAAPMKPVVTTKKPEGAYEPELNLKPRRASTNAPAAPMFEEPQDVPYIFPGMDLLEAPKPQTHSSPEEDALLSSKLEKTLQSFNVPAKVRHITHGPAISRFELELAAGIKVSKVIDLNRNIAMNLAVKSVRIEAPIPGKSLVGVEVPNSVRSTVTLREILESEPMRKSKKPLVVALGQDIAGTPIICDLEKMPHLLIAGQTGSGKSVCINAIINSLIYRCSPKDVRLIMIDPKVVELQCYNGIPHLLIPVVSDSHKASGALAWAVGEMMDRYKRLEAAGVRNIEGYNNVVSEDERIPRLVIIIDELADLMMTCKKDVEERINRLAQLARAAGIHLIVATQRPSTDVITGLIKANIPSRIAFKVASGIDSRTILGSVGAEQLLGLGDMLYHPTTESDPIRIQGCFLSDNEVNRITDFIRDNCGSDYDPAVLEELERLQQESDQNGGSSLPDMPSGDDSAASDSDLLTQCIEMAVQDGQVSTSLIQRRLRLGYSRAGRLVDEMEARGIVGPKDGAKPRKCLISREEFEAMRATGELG